MSSPAPAPPPPAAPLPALSPTAHGLALPGSWPGLATWALGWALMLGLDGRLDLANQALLLVATAALATLWLPGWGSAVLALAAVAGFNWCFVPPRGSWSIDLQPHAVLLLTLLVVVWLVAALVKRQQGLARLAARHAQEASRLRAWGEQLREVEDPRTHAGALQTLLAEAGGAPVSLWIGAADRPATPRHGAPQAAQTPDTAADAPGLTLGSPDADQRVGLALCQREARALGPGTGRHAEQPDLYLPLRARGGAQGAVVLAGWGHHPRAGAPERASTAHLQALCDLMGQALARAEGERAARRLQDAARDQATRSALLAAVAHDHRTPLATVLGAASALIEQAERLDPGQRLRLAHVIQDEASRLARLTDNTLQLARLDAPGVTLRCDWESAEDLVGAALQRARRRPEGERLRAWVAPGLPLLWCDALLLSQLLDNLVDNALKYSAAPVEVTARSLAGQVVLAVRDRGPGVAPAWRDRIFQAFDRGPQAPVGERPGAGLGLAVCQAIARAHGGQLRLRPRGHGGSAFECALPVRPQPEGPP